MPTSNSESSEPELPSLSMHEVVRLVRNAWYGGRNIVPIIGAGMSVDAGVPHIAEIIRYIAMVDVFVRSECFLPKDLRSDRHEPSPFSPTDVDYRNNPAKYVFDFGWPDRFDVEYAVGLNHPKTGVASEILKSRDRLIQRVYSNEIDAVRKLQTALDSTQDPNSDTKWQATSLLLDWRKLLRVYTDFKPELSDSLFAAIHGDRNPGLAHLYLVELVKLLGSNAIFTFNFDQLIEASLSNESVSHRVFAMEAGKSLPSSILVDKLSVIKMHGSTHNLLVDERLDQPLTNDYLNAFTELVGRNPLLLVIGCSGADRRLVDLVERTSRLTSCDTAVVWAHFCNRDTETVCQSPPGAQTQLREDSRRRTVLVQFISQLDQSNARQQGILFGVTHSMLLFELNAQWPVI